MAVYISIALHLLSDSVSWGCSAVLHSQLCWFWVIQHSIINKLHSWPSFSDHLLIQWITECLALIRRGLCWWTFSTEKKLIIFSCSLFPGSNQLFILWGSVIARQLTILKSLWASQSFMEIQVGFIKCINLDYMTLSRTFNKLFRLGFRPRWPWQLVPACHSSLYVHYCLL